TNSTPEGRPEWMQILITSFNSTSSEFTAYLTQSWLGRILSTVRTTPGATPDVDVRGLEARLVAAARRWDDELKQALIEVLGEGRRDQDVPPLRRGFSTEFTEA